MKHSILKTTLALAVAFSLNALADSHEAVGKAEEGHKADAATQGEKVYVGEIIDLACYINHGEEGRGPDHAKCAKKCLQGGLPAGLKTKDGTLYLLTGKHHSNVNEKVAEFAGKTVSLKAEAKKQDGMSMLYVAEVVSGKAGKSADSESK